MPAEPRSIRAERRELLWVDEALGREHRVERDRAVALGEEEAIAGRIVGRRWRDVEDPVVEDPDDIQGGERGRLVLLVAGHARDERRQVVVAERSFGGAFGAVMD